MRDDLFRKLVEEVETDHPGFNPTLIIVKNARGDEVLHSIPDRLRGTARSADKVADPATTEASELEEAIVNLLLETEKRQSGGQIVGKLCKPTGSKSKWSAKTVTNKLAEMVRDKTLDNLPPGNEDGRGSGYYVLEEKSS